MSNDKRLDPGTREGYLAIQQQLGLFAGLIQGLDIAGFVQALEHSVAITPLIHPSLFMHGAGKAEALRKYAYAALRFQAAAAEFQKTMIEEEAALGKIEEATGVTFRNRPTTLRSQTAVENEDDLPSDGDLVEVG